MSRFTLGSYRKVVESPLLLLALEPWTWTIPGLFRRTGHRRKLLLVVGAAHSIHSIIVIRRIRRNPETVDDLSLAIRDSSIALLRLLVYPSIAPRRSYWRGSADNAAFFMQGWLPPILLGAARGPKAALTAGALAGTLGYVGSAALNGESPGSFLRDPNVARRVFNYTFTSAIVGHFVATASRIMREADALAEEDRATFARLREIERWPTATRERADIERREQRRTLAVLLAAAKAQHAGHAHFEHLRNAVDAESSLVADLEMEHGRRVSEIIDHARRSTGVELRLDQLEETVASENEALVLRILLINTLRNSETHGRASAVVVRIRRRGRWMMVDVVDDGVGLTTDPFINPHHGLGRVHTLVTELLHGSMAVSSATKESTEGVRVRVTWERQQQS